jgi:hypothetical protein
MTERRRGALNEIVPGRLYQRGQILTWSLAKKRDLVLQNQIRWIVNFWPKLDPDLAELPLYGYLYVPLPDSAGIMQERIRRLAAFLAPSITENARALILCEAGVTRSLYFSTLLVREMEGIPGWEAWEAVEQRVPRTGLKPRMLAELRELGRP